MVNVVICYQKGTGKMLDACLSSIKRHTGHPHKVWLVTAEPDEALFSLARDNDLPLLENSKIKGDNHAHGALLDWAIYGIGHDYDFILTLDSDCFPVADFWLQDLMFMMENGARIAGILHPWAPPPLTMQKSWIEWRVREQHCWESTHVACQLIRKSDFIELGQKYNDGDDTGLAVIKEARRLGWEIGGFKPTRCPSLLVQGSSFVSGFPPLACRIAHSHNSNPSHNPEFNRYSCVIFGDKIYHHGGFSRATMGADRPYGEELAWVTPLIFDRKGAEFLLLDDQSYRYQFDREEEVAAEKMGRLFGHDGRNIGGTGL